MAGRSCADAREAHGAALFTDHLAPAREVVRRLQVALAEVIGDAGAGNEQHVDLAGHAPGAQATQRFRGALHELGQRLLPAVRNPGP